ncbi:peptidyl-prolyl cis-trans isomerase B (cyclophilin B) [Saonia flava]|uniref:Peptidyl-prolyl cis-trans isomerase n=1 Tax=Saonia flava TaxID=523696 RepID=A0A846QY84_9FLAO|nr:peptidylprolyl isomerase [Saonia flava]NJB71183.1 peptidyl-prolyl cis-trans isomerase B (cyclophilin B) [Saonia flava]
MKKIVLLFAVILLFSYTEEKKYEVGQILTPKGEVLVWLYNETPKHKASFVQLANDGYWDSLTFNRVIPNFVAQGGCPDTAEGFNDSEYLLEPEFNDSLLHEYGALGAGRDGNAEKLSARCQFYIVQNKEGLHRLDGDYTVFGKVIKGMDVIDAIVNVERDSTDTPLIPISLDVNMISIKERDLQKLYPDFK